MSKPIASLFALVLASCSVPVDIAAEPSTTATDTGTAEQASVVGDACATSANCTDAFNYMWCSAGHCARRGHDGSACPASLVGSADPCGDGTTASYICGICPAAWTAFCGALAGKPMCMTSGDYCDALGIVPPASCTHPVCSAVYACGP